jgi:hypothetical protein
MHLSREKLRQITIQRKKALDDEVCLLKNRQKVLKSAQNDTFFSRKSFKIINEGAKSPNLPISPFSP